MSPGVSLAGSTKRSTVASRCTTANASGRGVWATSLPRMLRSHAIESGAVEDDRVDPVAWRGAPPISRRLSGEGRPACFRSWGTIGPRGGGGWSSQMRSTRFSATGTSVAPTLPHTAWRRSTLSIVWSHGS